MEDRPHQPEQDQHGRHRLRQGQHAAGAQGFGEDAGARACEGRTHRDEKGQTHAPEMTGDAAPVGHALAEDECDVAEKNRDTHHLLYANWDRHIFPGACRGLVDPETHARPRNTSGGKA